jgi:prepilin-type N-terminal cleavage/methylation domain-containing protein
LPGHCDAVGHSCPPRPGARRWLRAFTLIELMIVIAIIAVVMTMAVPAIYKHLHPESMQKAVTDVLEACNHARAHAILNGVMTELVVRPYDRQIDVAPASRPAASSSGPLGAFAPPPAPVPQGGGGGAFSVKLSEHIMIEGIRLNFLDFTEDDVVRVRFYPNGTSDEFSLFLLSDKNERRQISLEVVTALADVESDPMKFR